MWRWAMPVALTVLLAGCGVSDAAGSGPERIHSFVSRADLHPPVVEVQQNSDEGAPGYVFLVPRVGEESDNDPQSGLLMVGSRGEPVWSMPFAEGGVYPNDLKVQTYRGEPVITFWRGTSSEIGWGSGEYVLLDESYQEVATVDAQAEPRADFHDLVLTARDTALLLSYPAVQQDRLIREGMVQEVDIATGEVLFEWHSSDHIDLAESFEPPPDDPQHAYDYFHINSVDEDPDGNLLLSARHTHALYKIDRDTGAVLWRLGGNRSDFALGDGVGFGWQHDARWLPNGRISLLDNVSKEDGTTPPSRALVLDVDENARTAEVVSAHANPDGVASGSQANHQVLPDGTSFVGWGSMPSFTRFDPNGDVLLHASIPDNMFSYRAFLAEWTGRPAEAPAVAAHTSDGESANVFASWNGSTEVASWRVLAGPSAEELHPMLDAPRTGFETAIAAATSEPVVAVEALDARGAVIGRSPPAEVQHTAPGTGPVR